MKHRINLYGAEFRPQRQWVTLNQMALVWGCCLLVVMAMVFYYGWQQRGVSRELAQVRMALEIKRGETQQLDTKLAHHQPDIQLQQQLISKQEDLSAKQNLMRQLGTLSLQKSQSYAGLMADLARLRDANISVQRIEVREGYINLAGLASRSQDVPAWVNRFKQTPSLAGKQFGELALSRDKEGRLVFQLSGIERVTP